MFTTKTVQKTDPPSFNIHLRGALVHIIKIIFSFSSLFMEDCFLSQTVCTCNPLRRLHASWWEPVGKGKSIVAGQFNAHFFFLHENWIFIFFCCYGCKRNKDQVPDEHRWRQVKVLWRTTHYACTIKNKRKKMHQKKEIYSSHKFFKHCLAVCPHHRLLFLFPSASPCNAMLILTGMVGLEEKCSKIVQ